MMGSFILIVTSWSKSSSECKWQNIVKIKEAVNCKAERTGNHTIDMTENSICKLCPFTAKTGKKAAGAFGRSCKFYMHFSSTSANAFFGNTCFVEGI